MAKKDFYRCNVCGNIVGMIEDGGGTLVCCGEPMNLLEAQTADAANEKHVPVLSKEANVLTVRVGSVDHPMLDKHYIQWICIVEGDLTQRQVLKPGDEPVAKFIVGDGPITAFEYCNLHGLWKADL